MGTDAEPSQLSAPDRTLLEFLAEHRVVRANQVARLLGVSVPAARRRLRRLGAVRYVSDGRLYHDQPKHYLIGRAGLRALGRPPGGAPRLRQAEYRHDVGMAWLWLAARAGRFGTLRAIHSERHMRSHDARAGEGGERFGVRVIGAGANGGVRTHYPDMVIETAAGNRVAVELELTSKGATRLERIIARYAADTRFDAVLYLVDDRRLGDQIAAAADRVGASRFVHVQRVKWTERAGPPRARSAARSAARPRARGMAR